MKCREQACLFLLYFIRKLVISLGFKPKTNDVHMIYFTIKPEKMNFN